MILNYSYCDFGFTAKVLLLLLAELAVCINLNAKCPMFLVFAGETASAGSDHRGQ